MPFIPHTAADVEDMLAAIGVRSLEDLFADIPQHLRQVDLSAIPPGQSEIALSRLMHDRAQQMNHQHCFIGAGAYQHHIPGVVWEIASRGEFMTAYTPYQAEASQGTLTVLYEYQTMMSSLMGLDVSNASLYEGASALAETILMAIRLLSPKTLAGKLPTVLMPQTVHPHYREVVQTIVGQHQVNTITVPYEQKTGRLTIAALEAVAAEAHILILSQPNFFGVLEQVDSLTDWAKEKNMLVIAVVNPLAMALIKPPGQWGQQGVDMACGEGQPLGIPLSCGGPYYGFLCCKQQHIRQIPGRIVGRTQDQAGQEGFVLTLQTREQHIRRSKATSNICTNQGLMVTASTIYMSLMGPQGLRQIAAVAHQRATTLAHMLTAVSGIEMVFTAPFFNEFVLRLSQPVEEVLHALRQYHIQGGYALKQTYPELGECLLVCATETKTTEDLAFYLQCLETILSTGSHSSYANLSI